MLKLLIDTIRRLLNTKNQTKRSSFYFDQRIYFIKENN